MKRTSAKDHAADSQAGFTMIELISVIILLGILGVFTSLFIAKFIEGYYFTQTNAETALKAQVALDRISLEMKDIQTISALTDNVQVTYTNMTLDPAGASRTIKFVSPAIVLTTAADYTLIDRIVGFTLSASYADMDGNAATQEVAYLDIGFTVSGIPTPFTTRIFPRNMVPHP
jgi:prepilin-type N-terminal cleavage/methylation domain-containing protein